DFAHHPSAVRETLLALRSRHPAGKLWAVFEPRSATACRKLHQEQYPEVLGLADEVLLAPVARSLPESERLDVTAIAAELTRRGVPGQAFEGAQQIALSASRSAVAGDVIAVLSNGTFGGIHAKLISALKQRFEPAP